MRFHDHKKHLFGILLFAIVAAFIFLNSLPVWAEDSALTFTPNVSVGPGFVKGQTVGVDTQTLGNYIKTWYGFIIGTVGILASVMIMYGGFRWLTSRGGQAVSQAKDIIFSALIGLTLAFLSYTILYLINPDLLLIGLQPMQGIQYNANYAGDFAEPSWAMGAGGTPNGPGGVSNCTGGSVIGGYDFATYAKNSNGTTDCNHVSKVRGYYDQMNGKITKAEDAQKFLDKYKAGSPVKGDMVMRAAQANNVDPAVIIAEMVQDSSLGTAGVGQRTNNPGNIGNFPSGKPNHPGTKNPCSKDNPCTGSYKDGGTWTDDGANHVTTYQSWDAGVNAVGMWLGRKKAK